MKKHLRVNRSYRINHISLSLQNEIINTSCLLNYVLGARIFLTIAFDVVISGISEPVRFLIGAKARVNELSRFNDTNSLDISDTIWSSFKTVSLFTEEFDMILKQVVSNYEFKNKIKSFLYRLHLKLFIRMKHTK